MARVLGYGGIANTNGARDFSGKTEAAVVDVVNVKYLRMGRSVNQGVRGHMRIAFALLGLVRS